MSEIGPKSSEVVPAVTAPERPAEAVLAEGDATAAAVHDLEAEHAQIEDPERRCADIKIWIEAECDYFGIEPKNDPVADQLTEILFTHEQAQLERGRDGYDVTAEARRRLDRVVERGFVEQEHTESLEAEVVKAKQDELEARQDELKARQDEAQAASLDIDESVAEATALDDVVTAKEDEKAEVQFKNRISDLRAQGKNNTEIIAQLANDEAVPASERAKLRSFSKILTIAAAVPGDKAIVTSRINQLDLSQGVPDPVGFARSFLFDGPESHLKSGVSDATQEAIAAELGIVRNEFRAKTGGDVNDIYKKGVGTKLVRDPETGELREEPVFLEAGEDVEIREGQYIGLSDTNEPVMKIVGEHTYTSDLPENPTDHDMTMYGMTTQWIAKLNDVNMAEMFFPHSVVERGGGHIELNMPDDFNRAQRLSQAFFGAMAGYNGELLDQTDLDRIPYLMQFQNEKGDAVIGDVNPDQMRADYQRQGIIGKDGHLDWDRFAVMVEANRNGLYVSEQRYGQDAQAQAV